MGCEEPPDLPRGGRQAPRPGRNSPRVISVGSGWEAALRRRTWGPGGHQADCERCASRQRRPPASWAALGEALQQLEVMLPLRSAPLSPRHQRWVQLRAPRDRTRPYRGALTEGAPCRGGEGQAWVLRQEGPPKIELLPAWLVAIPGPAEGGDALPPLRASTKPLRCRQRIRRVGTRCGGFAGDLPGHGVEQGVEAGM